MTENAPWDVYLDGEVQHQTIGIVLGQFVDHRTPIHMFGHFREPRRDLRRVRSSLRLPEHRTHASGFEYTIGFLRFEVFLDQGLQVLDDHVHHIGWLDARGNQPISHQCRRLSNGHVIVREQFNDLIGCATVPEVTRAKVVGILRLLTRRANLLFDRVEHFRFHDEIRRREQLHAVFLHLFVVILRLHGTSPKRAKI